MKKTGGPEAGGVATFSEAERARADAKACVRHLKERARVLSDSMSRNFANGSFALASQDARQLSLVMDVLGQIDLES